MQAKQCLLYRRKNAALVSGSTVKMTNTCVAKTGGSYIMTFNGDPSNVNLNGYTLYVNGVATA